MSAIKTTVQAGGEFADVALPQHILMDADWFVPPGGNNPDMTRKNEAGFAYFAHLIRHGHQVTLAARDRSTANIAAGFVDYMNRKSSPRIPGVAKVHLIDDIRHEAYDAIVSDRPADFKGIQAPVVTSFSSDNFIQRVLQVV